MSSPRDAQLLSTLAGAQQLRDRPGDECQDRCGRRGQPGPVVGQGDDELSLYDNSVGLAKLKTMVEELKGRLTAACMA